MEEQKPSGVKIKFDDPNCLADFYVIVSPEEGFWQGGKYKFHVKVRGSIVTGPDDKRLLLRSPLSTT